MMLKIAVAGATGRMGNLLTKAVRENADSLLVAVSCAIDDIEELNTHLQREGLVNVALLTDLTEMAKLADAIIDFTSPEYSLQIAKACALANKIHICGTTGFNEAQNAQMLEFAKQCRMVKCANFSVGVNMLEMLVQQTASMLGDEYDIEIVEMHHHHKKDAPSGTALVLGQAAANGRKVSLAKVAEHGRVGMVGERKSGNIGFHALRGGDVIGDHLVIFAGNGERLELAHKSSSRRIYADGAIRAALWARNEPYGIYSMQDVLKQ